MPDQLEKAIAREMSRRDFLKKAAALGIAVPSVGAILAACSSSTATATPAPTQAAGATTGPVATPTAAPISANLADTMPAETQKFWLTDPSMYPAFQAKYPGESIVETNLGIEDPTMLRSMVAANNSASPDMGWMESGEMGAYAAAGLIADIDSWLTSNASIKSDIYDSLINLCTYSGKVQSLPWMTNNTAAFINTDAFAAAGVAIPSQDPKNTWTWDDFAAACKAITEKAGMKGWLMNANQSGWDAWLFYAWLGTNGGLFQNDAGDPTFNGTEGVETMTFLQGLAKAGYTAELDTGWDLTLWRQKKAAIVFNGPWNHPDLVKTPPDFKYTVVPYPVKKQPATNIGGDNLFIFKHSADRQKVSFDYAAFMLSTDFQVKFNIESGNLPVTKSATQHADYQAHLAQYPYLNGFINSVPYGLPRSAFPWANDARTAFGDKAWQQIMLKGADPKSALDDAAKAVTALKNS